MSIRYKTGRCAALLLTLLAGIVLLAGEARALTQVTIYAGQFDKTMADGTIVPMWGYSKTAGGPYKSPGDPIVVPSGETSLEITLVNTLPEDTSIVIPGLNSTTMTPDFRNGRVFSFDAVAAANGGSTTYAYDVTGVSGTFLYLSGAHISKQIPMGLYGPMKKDFAANTAYDGVSYDRDVFLLYSEIDPELNQAVADGSFGTPAYPSSIDYEPRYFLINGKSFSPTSQSTRTGQPGEDVLLRFLNAGTEMHAPTLVGRYMTVHAMDAKPLPYAKQLLALELSPQKTFDAVVTMPNAQARVPLMERRLHMTNGSQPGNGGMFTYLSVCPADIDGNGAIDRNDMLTLAQLPLGTVCEEGIPCIGDVNYDGVYNQTDLSLFLTMMRSVRTCQTTP